jgi:hypothetical protein
MEQGSNDEAFPEMMQFHFSFAEMASSIAILFLRFKGNKLIPGFA